jgi:inhibitor of KinA sporulation pathway (predicted exonuclease)
VERPVTILVVDVEATCWPDEQPELRNRQREISEIIEIGAVRLRGDDLAVDGEYQAFIRPVVHPELSAFCSELTSITQADVDGAPTFPDAWASFVSWFAEDLPRVVMASWSAYDHVLFARQCAEHGLAEPPWEHLDVKDEFGQWTFVRDGRRERSRLGVALQRLGVPQEGRAHRAIVDARNTAVLLQQLRSPHHLSPLGLHALRRVAASGDAPTGAAELREVLPRPARWYHRVRKELVRTGLCEELPHGRGVRLTPRGQRAVAALDLGALPPAVEPGEG